MYKCEREKDRDKFWHIIPISYKSAYTGYFPAMGERDSKNDFLKRALKLYKLGLRGRVKES